jgi:hypothetical protein
MKQTNRDLIIETPRGQNTLGDPIDGFQIVSLSTFHSNPHLTKSVKESPHQLYFDMILVITKGSGIHYVDFNAYSYKVGSVFILKEGQFHSWTENNDIEGYVLFFSIDFYSKLGLGMEQILINKDFSDIWPPHFVVNDRSDKDSLTSLLELIDLEYNLKVSNNIVLKSYINSFLVKLDYEYLKVCPDYKVVKRRLKFQELQNLLETQKPLSRNGNHYLQLIGCSFRELNDVTKRLTGFTLKEYIDNEIIRQSKRALASSDVNISIIANDLGFKEIGNFSKFFKKHNGDSPREFRTLIRDKK